jgi:hypothetical protein
MAAVGGYHFKESALKQLFSKRGSMLLSTCKPEEFSMYYLSLGGYFCTSFYETFLQKTGKASQAATTWNDIMNDAFSKTEEMSRSDKDRGTQHPQKRGTIN